MAATDFVNGRMNLQLPDFPFFNFTGSTIPVNTLVKVDTGHVLGASQYGVAVTPTTVATDTPLGITINAIPNGGQGNVQTIDGTAAWGIVDANGAVTAGTQVMPSASVNGAVRAYTAAAGNSSVGVALSTTAATADPILIMLQKRGVAT